MLSWRLVEETSQLVALCREAGIACEDLAELPDKRQREKAAERLLLCRAFGRPVVLCHDEQGAPSVKDETTNISITHTIHMVALAVNDSQVIGIDAEQADRKQVVRVRDKFLNAGDQSFIAPDDLTAHVIAWTAKEAIIKEVGHVKGHLYYAFLMMRQGCYIFYQNASLRKGGKQEATIVYMEGQKNSSMSMSELKRMFKKK